uniref:Uncharacterized protein n=1 Tax=Aegilops tauschii TaxID=37682 RepID=R7VYL3_AEGTA
MALQLLSDINLKPNCFTLTSIASACASIAALRLGSWEAGPWGFPKPKKDVYVCAIDLLARAGTLRHAFDPIDKMQFAPDESFCGALVACKMHRNVELGSLVARKIIEVANGVSMVSRGGY